MAAALAAIDGTRNGRTGRWQIILYRRPTFDFAKKVLAGKRC